MVPFFFFSPCQKPENSAASNLKHKQEQAPFCSQRTVKCKHIFLEFYFAALEEPRARVPVYKYKCCL